jgi:hypothetical protein
MPFFHEQLDDVDIQPQRLRQQNLVWSRSARCWLTDSERNPVAYWYDLSNNGFAIQDRDRLAATDSAQVSTQASLQFFNPHSLHRHSMTISSHFV